MIGEGVNESGKDGRGAVTACCVVFTFSCTLVLALGFLSLHVRWRLASTED